MRYVIPTFHKSSLDYSENRNLKKNNVNHLGEIQYILGDQTKKLLSKNN